MKKISAIIVNHNTWPATEKAIRTFLAMEEKSDKEVILVDNGSLDPVREDIAKGWGVDIFIRNAENLGFAKAVNRGIDMSEGGYILLLNSDMFVGEGTIGAMAEYLDNHPEAGLIGPKLVYPDGGFQISAGRFPTFWRELIRLSLLYKLLPFDVSYLSDGGNIRETDWLSGGCLLFRRKLIDDIGSLDENYFFGYEDMDFCLRAGRKGWKSVYFPVVSAVHHHGLSSGGKRSVFRARLERDGLVYFLKKNHDESDIKCSILRLIYDMKIAVFKMAGL